jgi:hypothetical protein
VRSCVVASRAHPPANKVGQFYERFEEYPAVSSLGLGSMKDSPGQTAIRGNRSVPTPTTQ